MFAGKIMNSFKSNWFCEGKRGIKWMKTAKKY